MKKTLVFSAMISGLIASQLALAGLSTTHGLKTYTGSHFPQKTTQQMAPNFVIAIGNHLDEGINMSVNAGNGSIYPSYAPDSTNFVYSYDPISSAYVVITDFYGQLIYRGTMYNTECIDIRDIGYGPEYKIADNCVPL